MKTRPALRPYPPAINLVRHRLLPSDRETITARQRAIYLDDDAQIRAAGFAEPDTWHEDHPEDLNAAELQPATY